MTVVLNNVENEELNLLQSPSRDEEQGRNLGLLRHDHLIHYSANMKYVDVDESRCATTTPVSSRATIMKRAAVVFMTITLFYNFRWSVQTQQIADPSKKDTPTNTSAISSSSSPTTTTTMHFPDGNLRILVTSGCSGSSIITTMIKGILSMHGYDTDSRWRSEIYRPHENPMFEVVQRKYLEQNITNATNVDISIPATLLLNQDSMKNGKFTFFKWQWGIMPSLLQYVGAEKVLYRGMVRENVLDRLICRVQDCFENGVGYPVYANNGTETHLCFDRRTTPNVKTKVYFHVDLMIKMLTTDILQMKELKARPDTETYEELLALEYTDDQEVFENSLRAWKRLIGEYVDVVDSDKIRHYLSSIQNTRNESYHEDSIENFDEVLEALKKENLDHYWRTRLVEK